MLACDICGGMKFCELNLCSDCKNGVDNMEQNFNSLQQLKAEIASIADSVEDYTTTGADAGTVACIVRDLRQLSAV